VQLRRSNLGAKRCTIEPSIGEQNHSHICGNNLSDREDHLGLDRALLALAMLGRDRQREQWCRASLVVARRCEKDSHRIVSQTQPIDRAPRDASSTPSCALITPELCCDFPPLYSLV
jgi:hypothetical protein